MIFKGKKRKTEEQPVQKIELQTEHIGLRAVVAAVLIVVAAVSFAAGVHRIATKSPGLTRIEPKKDSAVSCCGEFELQYELGRNGEIPTPQYKKLAARFAEINADAYRIFGAEEDAGACGNVFLLNSRPNEETEVAPELYSALELIKKHGCERLLFLAPVYEHYRALYSCTYDYEAEELDPLRSSAAGEYIGRLLSFVRDGSMISLELLGENRVRLNVGGEYMRFAADEGLDSYIDFFWLRNAFMADYMAERLNAEGYFFGLITSFDGYARHLGSVSVPLRCNISDRVGQSKYAAAQMEHKNSVNIVHFRNYMRSGLDVFRYYEWEDGSAVTPYIDIKDGLSKGPKSDLTVYSSEYGCAELALLASRAYLADELDRAALSGLAAEGVDFVYCEDRVLLHSDPDIVLFSLYDDGEIRYREQTVR